MAISSLVNPMHGKPMLTLWLLEEEEAVEVVEMAEGETVGKLELQQQRLLGGVAVGVMSVSLVVIGVHVLLCELGLARGKRGYHC